VTDLSIDGGAGDDRLLGGDGDDTITGGSGNDLIDGNRGSDTETGGSGNDTLQWDPGDGSDVLDGQDGSDTLQFNGSNAGEQIDVSANGARGTLHRDVADVTQDFGTIETVNVRTLGSADTVRVHDLTGTPIKTTNVDLAGFDGTPDAAADTVTLDGTDGDDSAKIVPGQPGHAVLSVAGRASKVDVSGGEDLDHFGIAGLGGNDKLTTDPGVTGTGVALFDGGTGTDTATFPGTNDDDEIGVANNGAFARVFRTGGTSLDVTAVENTIVQGLEGNDTVAGQNGLSTLTDLTIQGGDGEDRLLGGDGDDTISGGDGDDLIDGNRGSDTETGGEGNDTFQWDPGDGSDVLDGQSDFDTLSFNGSNIGEKIDLSTAAGSNRGRLTRDIAGVTQDFGTIETVNVRALGGADTVTVNDLSKTAVDKVNVDLSGFDGNGDAALDTIVENGTSRSENVNVTREGDHVFTVGLPVETEISGSEPTDQLQIFTLGGNDSVFVAPETQDLITTLVDLGVDQKP
jgi:Ca2+-binding RTX toxin-like protein